MVAIDEEELRAPSSSPDGNGRQPFDAGPLADEGERRAIFTVLDSFRQYRRQTHFNTTHRRRQNFYALPFAHQALLRNAKLDILDVLNAIDDAIDHNADIADAILSLALDTLDLPQARTGDAAVDWHNAARPLDLNKANSTVKQFWRDWSKPGFDAEVKPMLEMILQDMSSASDASFERRRILLPGAGLGRLLFELSLAGHTVEGNEISYHQLFASNFILNTTKCAHQYRLYPFISSFNNHQSRTAQLQYVTIPDVHPATAIAERHRAQQPVGEMSMSAGDFITSYGSKENERSFDTVATIYFIDTAPNLIRYIETIRHCLVDGGLWINIGPLLWHFEDRTVDKHKGQTEEQGVAQEATEQIGIAEPGSFELTDEEVRVLVEDMGFEVCSHEILPQSVGGYIQDPNSMLQNRYNCSHWVARKK